MRRTVKPAMLLAIVLSAAVSRQARAEGYVNPWAGVNFSNDVSDGRGALGLNAGSMGGGAVGAEFSFGYSPSFFGTENDFGKNNIIDLMGSAIFAIPIGGQRGAGFRPFVTAGLGMIHSHIEGNNFFDVAVSDNDFAWNAGAGVMCFFNDRVGLRGDLRYLRTINGNLFDSLDLDNGDFHFWRAGFGVVIR